MGVLSFKQIFFRSFVGSNGASQVVFIFLLIPCCFTKDYRATPFLPNISFLWAWNAPTEPCPKKFNVSIDLSLFSFIGNPSKDAIGQPVTIFYVDRLGLYPHIAAPFVRNRVKEAIRVSVVPNEKRPLPIYIYTRPVFTDDSSKYLNQEDLIHTLGETISLGASGLIIWGSLNLSQSVATCKKLHNYMYTTLNPYIINITLAAKMCSQVFCQEKGFCTRKNVDSSDYLHLNPMHFTIETDPNGKFKIKGKSSVEDLKHFAENFHCSCYSNTDCEKEVNLTHKITIDVCMMKDICIKTVLNS
ncbi:hyaluronidase PH-20-like isoform X2 [Eptesicus fuscus]|uniref:hyaluronidase PH-20-like isoform X2 n=1 Tax=Eptesicus fuscus TaxID=29078 RepID=UPI002403BB06|nr:hyaluronidase PH-20-like isoform X2 [Eptesicus fuscus]